MNFFELVKHRSSVRKYDLRPVKRELIVKCIEAARLAPSACNSQPWQFIVVDTLELKNKLCDAMLGGAYGIMNHFIKEAPVLVIVVIDKAKWLTKSCNVINNTKLYLIDIGIACSHFILQAAELGLGTCILGWFNERAVKRLLGIPRTKRAHIIISMGYPSVDFKPKEKNRKTLSEISLYV